MFFEKNDSATVTQRVFRLHFDIGRNGKVPTRQTILNWVTQFRTTASIVNKKPRGRPGTLRTPENVRRMAHAFERRQRVEMCLTSNGAHLSDIIFKSRLENVMLFHVANHCLSSYDLIFNQQIADRPVFFRLYLSQIFNST
jgi:hypothetical protein